MGLFDSLGFGDLAEEVKAITDELSVVKDDIIGAVTDQSNVLREIKEGAETITTSITTEVSGIATDAKEALRGPKQP